MKVSICIVTGRKEPHVDWIVDGLATQLRPDDDVDLLIIDALAHDPKERPAVGERELAILRRWPCTYVARAMPPKPTIWAGPHRVTARDWWSKSSSINSAICLARHDYVAFLDDCCRLGPRWLDMVRAGEAARASVLAGSYDKHERGTVTVDGRRDLAPADGKIDCGGGWLFGCTWAAPLAWLLDVNGAEEGVDGMGGEDYLLGLMLANAGHRIDFLPQMLVVQSRPEISDGSGGAYRRTDKGTSPLDKSHAALARFGVRRRTELTPDLTAIRAELAAGGDFPVPDPVTEYRDWFDGQLIHEMI